MSRAAIPCTIWKDVALRDLPQWLRGHASKLPRSYFPKGCDLGNYDQEVKAPPWCWTPGPVPLARLIATAVTRWRVEEDHQLAKQAAGLDCGQVIRWKSWHRWTAICLLAYIYLAVAAAVNRDSQAGQDIGLIPITIPELLRLLRDIVIPPPCRDQAHRQHWSQWRRRHQYRARQAHQRWNAYADTVWSFGGSRSMAM